MKVTEFVGPEAIVRLAGVTHLAAIRELSAVLSSQAGLPQGEVEKLLLDREQLGSTALGHEIAVPHERAEVARVVGAIGLSEVGVEFPGAPDGKPVKVVVAFLSPRAGGLHLKALAAVVQSFSEEGKRRKLLATASSSEAYRLLSGA